jgi:hypothetical protein
MAPVPAPTSSPLRPLTSPDSGTSTPSTTTPAELDSDGTEAGCGLIVTTDLQ